MLYFLWFVPYDALKTILIDDFLRKKMLKLKKKIFLALTEQIIIFLTFIANSLFLWWGAITHIIGVGHLWLIFSNRRPKLALSCRWTPAWFFPELMTMKGPTLRGRNWRRCCSVALNFFENFNYTFWISGPKIWKTAKYNLQFKCPRKSQIRTWAIFWFP